MTQTLQRINWVPRGIVSSVLISSEKKGKKVCHWSWWESELDVKRPPEEQNKPN